MNHTMQLYLLTRRLELSAQISLVSPNVYKNERHEMKIIDLSSDYSSKLAISHIIGHETAKRDFQTV